MFKKCRDPLKWVVTLAKIQSAREASHFDGQLQHVLLTCLCLCIRVYRVVAVA